MSGKALNVVAAVFQMAEWEAIRQTVMCPTCNGTQSVEGRNIASHDHCWDCEDGKIPMARLVAVGAAVFGASLECTWDEQGVLVGDTLHVRAYSLLTALKGDGDEWQG